MRIAIASPALRLGGLERYTRTLGGQLAAAGHAVEFVETRWRGDWAARFREGGLTVRSLPLRALRSPAAHARRVARVLAAYDAVIANDDAIARAGVGLLPAGTATIVVIHADLESQYETAIGSFDDCDAVVGVSDAIVGKAAPRMAGRSARLVRVTGGVRVPEAWPKAGSAPGGPLAICYVGRVSDWQKGVFLLPEILKGVLDAGVDARLTVAGDGPDLAELKLRCAAAGVAGRVDFAGALDEGEVGRLLDRSEQLLLPTRLEGFPLAPLEAMARGVVPVVTLLPGSTDRMIADGVHGALVPLGDVAGFVGAMVALARDRERLRRMSEAGWRRVREEFSEKRMGRDYLRLIGELRARPRTVPRSGRIDLSLLGDFPRLPFVLVRPTRKLWRVAGFSRGRRA